MARQRPFAAPEAELLDLRRLGLAQLATLERRTARGGRDTIDHGPNGHDDVTNAACGALLLATVPRDEPIMIWGGGAPSTPTPPETPEETAAREAATAAREQQRKEQSARAVSELVRETGVWCAGGRLGAPTARW